MRNQIHSELVSLRTLRSSWGVLALVVLGAAGIALGDFSEVGTPKLDSFAEMRENLARDTGFVTAILAALFAASRIGAEYRYGTIVHRALAAPARARLIASRVGVYGGLGAVAGALAVLAALPGAKIFAASEGMAFAITPGQTAELVGAAALGAGVFAVLGVAVGFITRSQPAAILVVLGAFAAEQIVLGIVQSAGQYMPFQLLNAELGLADIAPGPAAVAMVGVGAVVAGVAAVLMPRRDVI